MAHAVIRRQFNPGELRRYNADCKKRACHEPRACPTTANSSSYRVAIYAGPHAPHNVRGCLPLLPEMRRRQLNEEYARADANAHWPEDVVRVVRLCQGKLPGVYAAGSLADAQIIGLVEEDDTEPPAVFTAFFSNFIHPHTQKSVCAPHEIYLDVMCAYICPKGCGRMLFDALWDTVRAWEPLGYRAIRIHSTYAALPYWRRLGFENADTALVEMPNPGRTRSAPLCVYTNLNHWTYYRYETDLDNRNSRATWRLTRIVTPGGPIVTDPREHPPTHEQLLAGKYHQQVVAVGAPASRGRIPWNPDPRQIHRQLYEAADAIPPPLPHHRTRLAKARARAKAAKARR